MAAFADAVTLGYTFIETDAHGTLDGIAVALHDSTLDRTTDRTGDVAKLPWKEVREARISGDETVPSLEDVLTTWPWLRVNIDVKTESGIIPIAESIERTKAHDRVCITSFSRKRRLATVKRLSKPVATSAGTSEVARFLAGVRLGLPGMARKAVAQVDCLQVPVKEGVTIVDRKTVDAAHALGKLVMVWTIDERAEMERLLDLGVDGIVTDRADVLKDVLVARNGWF
jgi:glycerophosphoryl diester phosphodiesterase